MDSSSPSPLRQYKIRAHSVLRSKAGGDDPVAAAVAAAEAKLRGEVDACRAAQVNAVCNV